MKKKSAESGFCLEPLVRQTRLSFAHCDVWGRFPTGADFFLFRTKKLQFLFITDVQLDCVGLALCEFRYAKLHHQS